MGDNLRFFSSASPDSSHGHGHTQNGYGPEFAGAWIEPGGHSDYGPEDYAARAEDELQRLISTDGPTTSWLYSDYDPDSPQTDAHSSSTESAPIQRKLTVGSANDPLEEEADAVAERVMRNPRDFYLDPRVSSFQPYMIGGRGEKVVARLRAASQEEEAAQMKARAPNISRLPEQEEEIQQAPAISRMGEQDQDEDMQFKSLQRNLAGMDDDAKDSLGYTHAFEKSMEEEELGTTTSMYMQREGAASPEGGTVSPERQRRIEGVRNGGGEKLPESEREFFESRMGHDFSDVRIHTGSEAAQVSRDMNAKAFTIGRDVVFGEGEYKPGTSEGRRLMAHELTHTVQQGATGSLRRDSPQEKKPETDRQDIDEAFERIHDGVGQPADFALVRAFGAALEDAALEYLGLEKSDITGPYREQHMNRRRFAELLAAVFNMSYQEYLRSSASGTAEGGSDGFFEFSLFGSSNEESDSLSQSLKGKNRVETLAYLAKYESPEVRGAAAGDMVQGLGRAPALQVIKAAGKRVTGRLFSTPSGKNREYVVPRRGTTRYAVLMSKFQRFSKVRGNQTINGAVNPAEAEMLGKKWVGPGYKESRTKKGETIYIAKDGLRQYRSPAYKKESEFSKTGWQVNFQSRPNTDTRFQDGNNAHLDVLF